MDRFRAWRKRIRSLIRRSDAERELREEIDMHLRMETEHRLRSGLDREAARRGALLAFGGVDRFTEDVRDVRRLGWFEDVTRDVRHSLRAFRRDAGFTAAAVLTIALGTGANIAVFTVVHAVLLAPLPYAEPDRLVRVWEESRQQGIDRGGVSPGTFVDLRERSDVLDRLGVFLTGERLLSFGDATALEAVRSAAVSPSVFEMLGVRPVLGRAFRPEDQQEPPFGDSDELVIGYGLWQRHFGGSAAVLGQTVRSEDGRTLTVVGVMPPGFTFPDDTEVWRGEVFLRPVSPVQRQFRFYRMIGQLRPGTTLQDARAEGAAIAARLGSEHPASNAGYGLAMEHLEESIVGTARPMLLVLLGLVACLLLIACGNVLNLLVARSTARRYELAVRLALGARGGSLLRQRMVEGGLLALLGGLAGLFVAWIGVRGLIALAPPDLPRLDEVRFAAPVLWLALCITAATALVAGLGPALQSRKADVADVLKGGGRIGDGGGVRTREWLVGLQVALTVVLLVSATLLLRSFVLLRGVDLGFESRNVLTAELRIPSNRFDEPRPWARLADHFDRLLAELGTAPRVGAIGGIRNVPLSGDPLDGRLWRTDAPGAEGRRPPHSAADQWTAAISTVTPGFFEAMSIPLLRGRTFTATDRTTAEALTDPSVPRPAGAAVVNAAMARRYWPEEDPIGQTLVLFDDGFFAAYRTVVGVVGDVRAHAVDRDAAPTVYVPHAQFPSFHLSIVVRTDVRPEQLQRALTDRIRAFDPHIVVSLVRPMDDVVAGAVSRPRFNLLLVGSFAALALLLAVIGVAGVVGYAVVRRTRDLGLRMALGARPMAVLRLVLGEGLKPVVAGAVAGGILAVAVARSMRALLFGLTPLDPWSFALATLLLVGAALLAALLPARRATRIDPATALRAE